VELIADKSIGEKRVVLFADDFPDEKALQDKIAEYPNCKVYIIRFINP
jgi:hypothetical protein